MKVNRDKFFKLDIEISPDMEDGMYEQLQRNLAKALDIDFAKTPLVDLLTGYKRYVILQQRIDKAIDNCKKSIESINQKLQDDKTIKVVDGIVVNMNEYQIVRLKAIRMKCKEILEILGGKNNGN